MDLAVAPVVDFDVAPDVDLGAGVSQGVRFAAASLDWNQAAAPWVGPGQVWEMGS